MIEPLDVIDFHNFAKQSYFILTDSGGIQEEAPSFNKPVLVLRSVTERPEGVDAGTLKVVGTHEQDVYRAAKELIDDERLYHQMSEALNPYGDGFASERIVNHIKYYLNLITENQAISIKKIFCLNVSKLCLNMLIFYNNLNRIDTTNRLYYHLVCMSGTVFMIDISHTEAYKMSRFYNIFKQFIQYYLYLLIILGGLYLYTHHAFILGLIIGVTGSAINTVIFESYLAKAKRPDTMHISTGNMWRY